MIRRLLLAVFGVISLAIVALGVAIPLARQRWRERISEAGAEVAECHPARGADGSALRLEGLAAGVGVPLSPPGLFRKPVHPELALAAMEQDERISTWLDAVAESDRPVAAPEEVTGPLVRFAVPLSGIEAELLSASPRWEIDREGAVDPELGGVLVLSRLLAARGELAISRGDPAAASRSVRALRGLVDALDRGNEPSARVRLALLRRLLVLLRRHPEAGNGEGDFLLAIDPGRDLAHALLHQAVDGARRLETFRPPSARWPRVLRPVARELSALRFALSRLELAALLDPGDGAGCDAAAREIDVVRVSRVRLEIEMTLLVLRSRRGEALPPESPSACGGTWRASAAGGGTKIALDPPVRFGEGLRRPHVPLEFFVQRH